MTVRQDRYVDPDTSVIKVKESSVSEAPKVPDNPVLRALDVQQTVNNSTMPISSRAVKLAIDNIEVPSLDGYATEDYVDDSIASLNIEQYAKASTLDEKADKTDITELQSSIDKKVDTTTFSEEMSKKLEQKDLAGYATEDYVSIEISKIPEVDLTPYAKKADLNAYLTIEASSGLADKQYVDDAISGIEIPSLDGYATKNYVDQKFGSIDLSSYATNQYVDGELTLKADKSQLEGLATKEWVEDRLSEFMVEVREEIQKALNGEPEDGGV